MLLLRLWNYIRGYVIIVVKGYFPEKFINICMHRKIFLWDIKRLKNNEIICSLSIKSFRNLRAVAKKTKSRVSIRKKTGLPFVLNRYKHRKAFLIGAVVFIAALYIITSFVWSVEIDGNKNLNTDYLQHKLADMGIKPGTLKFGIDPDLVANRMILDVKGLAWVGITVKGTKVKVSISEGVTPPELVPKNIPCDIIASKDGVIKTVTAKSGQEMVKAGDTVVKGQVLVSGRMLNTEVKDEQPRFVHAIGTVIARTWYEERCPVNIHPVEKERTGQVENNYALLLFGKKIKLFPGKIKFENSDRVEINKSLSIGKDMVLPFGIIIEKYYENRLTVKELDLDIAKKAAADTAYKQIMKQVGDESKIVKAETRFIDDEKGKLTACVTAECNENIGITQEIGGN
ncbi:MAG: sporulation protein YqfD [Bacillota bacterium]|nr:sporulation protein YqfD [Bacillota bacterium]